MSLNSKETSSDMQSHREVHELPLAIEKWGWQYHHLGIPTDQKMPDEKYIPHLGMYVTGFQTSPFGIEWMRFDEMSPILKIIQINPHIAFQVVDLDQILQNVNIKILSGPDSPSEGVRVVMLEHNNAIIELIEFIK